MFCGAVCDGEVGCVCPVRWGLCVSVCARAYVSVFPVRVCLCVSVCTRAYVSVFPVRVCMFVYVCTRAVSYTHLMLPTIVLVYIPRVARTLPTTQPNTPDDSIDMSMRSYRPLQTLDK